MKNTFLRPACIAAWLLTAAAAATAQPATTTPMAPARAASPAMPGASAAMHLQRSDAGFLKQAAENGHAEVESSRIALKKASDANVKAFAQRMVDDHTAAGQKLNALAKRKGVEVSDSPSLIQKAKLKLLEAADGAEFDRKYAQSMGVEAHEETVEMFEKAAKDARDPDVKAFASQTLPTLREHLTMARTLAQQVGAKR